MMKILLDADASIKLTKIGIIEIFVSCFEVILANEVYSEHVTAGLNHNYPDAIKMKKLVTSGKVIIAEVAKDPTVYDNFRLGRGEKSVLNYFVANDIALIISDDEAFLKVLNRFEIPFTPVAGAILMCILHKLVSKEKGLKYLESYKPMIKDEHMFYIKSKIEELL